MKNNEGEGALKRGGLNNFLPLKGGGVLIREVGLNRTGSWFSACSLIKLIFSNLLLLLSINNPTSHVSR